MSAAVLLVEDDPTLAEALGLVLEARGIRVRRAGTASEALEALETASSPAVVADLGLPDAGGPELVRSLRRAAPDARLLVLTGEDSDALRQACLDAGADAYLVKPVAGDDLASAIRG